MILPSLVNNFVMVRKCKLNVSYEIIETERWTKKQTVVTNHYFRAYFQVAWAVIKSICMKWIPWFWEPSQFTTEDIKWNCYGWEFRSTENEKECRIIKIIPSHRIFCLQKHSWEWDYYHGMIHHSYEFSLFFPFT